MESFEPKILAFLCNWCAYGAADLAGVSRFQYPENIRPVRVMCSARVDPVFILEALREGWDGVLVAGCHFGDCHYVDGNVQAEKKIRLTHRLLDLAGVDRKRLHLAWCSSAEGQRFAEIVREVVAAVSELGPFDPDALGGKLAAAEQAAASETVRWLVGKEVALSTRGDVYGEKRDPEALESVIDHCAETEFQKNAIRLALKAGCRSVRDIAERTDMELRRISGLLSELEKASLVVFKGHENRVPVFEAL